MIYSNYQIRSLDWENIRTIFTPVKAGTYQPIRVLSYAVDYYFWELNPLGYHITNIFFYILTCMMVFLSLQLLSRHLREGMTENSHFRVALLGSFLFAAHPVHVEAVTWLAARKEVLQGFFFFLGFYLYLKLRGSGGKKKIYYLTFVLISFVLATLSKPSAVIFPGIIVLYEISRTRLGIIRLLKNHWLFFILSLVISTVFTYLLIRVMVDAGGIKKFYGDSFLSNYLVSLSAFLRYIKLLIFTGNYSAAYSFSVTLPVFHIKNIAFIIINLSMFLFSIFSLRWTKVIFFSFFFFVIALLPYLNIIPISILLADRYVFIASFSYIFLFGILLDRLYLIPHSTFSKSFFKMVSIVLFLLLMVGYSYITIQQNRIWKNSFTLWDDAVRNYPESNTANALMGVVYMNSGMYQEAMKYLEKAIQILPSDYHSRNNLGVIYGKLGQSEKGVNELLVAIRLRPKDDAIRINLSVLYMWQGEYNKAEAVLKDLLSKNPQNANLHFRLGLVFKGAEQYEAAISEFLKSMELAPHIINPYEELGNVYAGKLKDLEKARYYYAKGIEAVPKAKSKVEDLRWMIQDLEAHQ